MSNRNHPSTVNTTNVNDLIEEEKDFGFARVYAVELQYKVKPEVDFDLLYRSMERYTGQISAPEPDNDGNQYEASEERNEARHKRLLHYFHLNYMVQYAEGELPAQTSLFPITHRPISKYAHAIQQSRHWPGAAATLEECRHTLLLVDMMAAGLDPRSRLRLFTGALQAVLETAPCDAIYFRESDKLVEPGAFIAAARQGDLLYGAMNIRLYHVNGHVKGNEETRKEMLMDSIGLAALGIPDVQCHFYDLDPPIIASHLASFGHYLLEHGNHISDRDTVLILDNIHWSCEHQYALVAPHRVVYDINPGAPYYAGRRKKPLV